MVVRLLAVAGVLASAGTVLAFFSAWSWLTELTSHFRVQYFAVLAVATVASLVVRRPARALAFAACALTNLAMILPLYVDNASVAVDAPVTPVRVMFSNVFAENRRYGLLLDAVDRYRPDVLVVEEVNEGWFKSLQAVSAEYPYSIVEPRDGRFGIALYSRHPLRDARIVKLGVVASIVADVQIDAAVLRVLATHAMPPFEPTYARLRNEQLEEIGRFLKEGPRPVVLVGDLNVTPWSAHFTRLLEQSDLADSMRGHGPQFTWPAQVWPVGVPIDHCLYSPGVRVVAREVGPSVGSDHYPIIVDLEVGNPATLASR